MAKGAARDVTEKEEEAVTERATKVEAERVAGPVTEGATAVDAKEVAETSSAGGESD